MIRAGYVKQAAKDFFPRATENQAYVTIVTEKSMWHFICFSADSHVGTNRIKRNKQTKQNLRFIIRIIVIFREYPTFCRRRKAFYTL